MKNIAVLIPSFTIEYSIGILDGIYDYFIDKDVNVIIAHTKFSHSKVSPFDYQYWSSVDYVKAKDIDGYIIVSGLYVSSISMTEFDSIIESLGPRPVVSIGVNSDRKNVYTVKADCDEIYFDIVKHLKEKHGCKKIAFFSANSSDSAEALARYNAFVKAMKDNKLSFDPGLVMDGNFTDFTAEEQFLAKYKNKADIDFDSIVCANDSMAAGCVRALQSLGVSVPDEIKVVGFDDAVVSRILNPKLSTINQNISMQGFRAAELMNEILTGKKCDKDVYVPLEARFRQSCGCISCADNSHVYLDANGKAKEDGYSTVQTAEQFFADMNEKNNLMTLMDTLSCSNTLKQFFYNLRYLAEQCDMPEVYINLFKDVIYNDPEDDFEMPEQLELAMLCDLENNVHTFKPGVIFNPKECFFASRSVKSKPGIYIVHPIFACENSYGCMFCKIKNKNFADYIVHLKIIVNSIAQSFDYTNQITQAENLKNANTDLHKQSRTDELTKILNRRGFIEQGQAALDLMQEIDKAGVIFFADMDGLKIINDTYGHEMGDKAIRLQAEVLKSAFRSTDIVGRLSGDEFGVVAVGMNLSQVNQIRLKVQLLAEKISKINDLPFILSCSIGAVDLQKSSVLKRLLSEADKELYEEKRKKRNARLSLNTK